MKKKLNLFRSRICSRHPTHSPLRTQLELLPFRSVIRFGSTTEVRDTVANGGDRIEINSVEGIKNSSDKLLMKECFTKAKVKTADWYISRGVVVTDDKSILVFEKKGLDQNFPVELVNLPFPIVVKHRLGSRGTGNYKIDTPEQYIEWSKNRDMKNYLIEKFYSYQREYRLHIDSVGCFYTCRKMIKEGTEEKDRWHRHESNSIWIMPENPLFDIPINWNDIVQDCIIALKELNLDFAGFDIKIQSKVNKKDVIRENPEYIIIESNSACSLGAIGLEKYKIQLPIIAKRKFEEINH